MKRASREAKLKAMLKKLKMSREVSAVLLDIWREIDGAHADSDARQRAEIRRLRAELREVARCTECVQCHVRAERVLAPKRRARK